jgi:hypothetical protein
MDTIDAIVGLIGAIKFFQKWNRGDEDTSEYHLGYRWKPVDKDF